MPRRLVLALCALLLPVSGLAVNSPAVAAVAAPDGLAVSSENASDIPTLSWDRVAAAVKYEVEVSASSSFGSILSTTGTAGTTNLQWVPPKQLPSGELWFRVRSVVSSSDKSGWSSFSFSRQRGTGPTPLSPANNAQLEQPDDPVLLSWSPVRGATEYVVQVSSNAGFTEPSLIKEYKTLTTSLVRPDQEAARPYYWRVAGVLGTGLTTQWSSTRSYTLLPLAAARLTSPADGGSLPPIDDVVLDWEPVPGAASYDVEISLVPDFSTIAHKQVEVLGTRYSPPTTLDNATYYWRVRSRDVFDNLQGGDTATTWTFRRAWSEQPDLQYPAQDEWVGDPFFYQWSPVRLASRYQLTVKGTGLPPSGRTCITTETTYTPKIASECMPVAAGSYTWQVIALDDPRRPSPVQTSPANAQTGRFSYVPDLVQPLTPASGSQVTVPTVTWGPVAGAAQYNVVVVNNQGEAVADTVTRATNYTPSQLLDAGTYRWYVTTIGQDERVGATPNPSNWRSFTVVEPTAPTAATPEPTSASGSYRRFPALTWTPVGGATHYRVLMRQAGQPSYSVLPHDFAYPAGSDEEDNYLTPGEYLWRVEAYADGVRLSRSQTEGRFTIAAPPSVTGQRLALSGTETGSASTSCSLTAPDPCRGVGQTPVFRWDPQPDTASYRLWLAYDRDLSNPVGKNNEYADEFPVVVNGTSYTPPKSLPEADAGTAYYWVVQPCVTEDICRPVENANHSFNKLSQKVEPVSPGVPFTGTGQSLPQVQDDITLTWRDYLATNTTTARTDSSLSTRSRTEAQSYRIQVATDPQFNELLDDEVVDQTTFTSFENTYPDTQLYWRVQAIDGQKNPLPWSPRWTFEKQSPVPQPVGPSGAGDFDGSTPLRWQPLAYAAKYEVELYRNNDTQPDPANLVTSGVVAQSAVSWIVPVAPSPQPYTWRVRRVDGGGYRGDWSAWRSYTVSSQTVQLHGPADLTRVEPTNSLFTWAPVAGAATYRWERRVEGSSTIASTVTTPATAYAPTATLPDGDFEWRVTALDTSANGGKPLGTSEWRDFDVVGSPQALTTARIDGTGAVGTMLTGTDPDWDLDGVTNAYQWYRGTIAIAGATTSTYEVTLSDVGKALTLRVTGSLPGYASTAANSNAITGVSGAPATTATPPEISGTGAVGSQLTATAPTWNEPGVSTTYRWMRDNVAISGATKMTYTVLSSDVGKELTLQATGKRSGYADAVAYSNPITAVAGEAPVNTEVPTITGDPEVGESLRVDRGTWEPATSLRFTYQWLRDGAPVGEPTSSTSYRVVPADAGRALSVIVTASKPNYQPAEAQSEEVVVRLMASKASSTLSPTKVKRTKRAKLRVTVDADGTDTPTGSIVVMEGRRTVARATLTTRGKGVVSITLPKLAPGRHRLQARYGGSSQVKPSNAKVVTLTVTR